MAFVQRILDRLKEHRLAVTGFVLLTAVTAFIEFQMGRSLLGPDGKFGWWEGSIWSAENSQRVADAYSFSHIIHGILFFALLWWLLPKVPLRWRFLIAVVLEASWEILENSPIIIDRYREATIALGYVGDSILNSCSDIAMMALGFLFALRARIGTSIGAIVVMELGCLLWIRDNLTLNVLMLTYPIQAIKLWQSAGQPTP